jgi:ABC-type sugar transport system substrate-binding protein
MGDGLMSNFDYEDEDDDTTQDLSQNNDLVKQLRKANKQKEKELAELKAQFDGVSKAQRERAIKDVLEARGVNKKVASFIPSDIDPTEESLSKWLTEYGDVFGITAEPTQDVVDPAQAAAYKKMNSTVDSGLTPDSSDDMLRKILNANSKEELDEVIRQSGL